MQLKTKQTTFFHYNSELQKTIFLSYYHKDIKTLSGMLIFQIQQVYGIAIVLEIIVLQLPYILDVFFI